MRFRVVWGLRVTMASFSPTSAFSSVDFPALGRPMMETKPERNDMSGPHLLRCGHIPQADTHALNAALGGIQDLEAQTVVLEDFPWRGNSARQFAHQSADGGCVFLVGPDASQQFLQKINIGVSVKDVGTLALLHDV